MEPADEALLVVWNGLVSERPLDVSVGARTYLRKVLATGYERFASEGRVDEYQDAVSRLTQSLSSQVTASLREGPSRLHGPADPEGARPRDSDEWEVDDIDGSWPWRMHINRSSGRHQEQGAPRTPEIDQDQIEAAMGKLCPGFWPFC